METVLIVIHLMVVLALVGVVLLQRSEGGGLGIGGGSGFMTARGAANALTRTTSILAIAFFATSLALSIMARYGERPIDILDRAPATGALTYDSNGNAAGGSAVPAPRSPRRTAAGRRGDAGVPRSAIAPTRARWQRAARARPSSVRRGAGGPERRSTRRRPMPARVAEGAVSPAGAR